MTVDLKARASVSRDHTSSHQVPIGQFNHLNSILALYEACMLAILLHVRAALSLRTTLCVSNSKNCIVKECNLDIACLCSFEMLCASCTLTHIRILCRLWSKHRESTLNVFICSFLCMQLEKLDEVDQGQSCNLGESDQDVIDLIYSA